jgi:hypothetical protein
MMAENDRAGTVEIARKGRGATRAGARARETRRVEIAALAARQAARAAVWRRARTPGGLLAVRGRIRGREAPAPGWGASGIRWTRAREGRPHPAREAQGERSGWVVMGRLWRARLYAGGSHLAGSVVWGGSHIGWGSVAWDSYLWGSVCGPVGPTGRCLAQVWRRWPGWPQMEQRLSGLRPPFWPLRRFREVSVVQ